MIFQIGAVVILLLFYGCYFGKMLCQRKKGIQTDQMGKGKTGTALWIERALKAASVCVPVAEVICISRDQPGLPPGARITGLLLAALGTAVFYLSVITMRDNWRAGVSKEETELVVDGIYRISRNPAFLGFNLVYVGILLMFFSWVLFALSFLAAVLLHLQIVKVEEPFLEEAFGEEYTRYRKKVKRYLGRNCKHFGNN